MGLGRSFQVGDLATRAFEHRLSLPVPTHDGGWVISFQDHQDVIFLDPLLNETQRLDLQAQSQQYCSTAVALSEDGRLVAVSARSELRIVGRSGDVLRRIPHEPWDSFAGSGCFFDPGGRLWYVRPGDDPGINDRLTVIEPNSGVTIAERAIENEVGYFDLHHCPDGRGALIDIACGQDGSFLHLARLVGSDLSVTQYDHDDRTFYGGFSPDGREFATGAHGGDAVKVHSFPDGRVIASLGSEAVFAEDTLIGEVPDEIGYQALFLDENRLLAETQFGRMLLIDRTRMQTLGTVWAKGCGLRGYDRSGKETDEPSEVFVYESGLTSFHSAGSGKVLAVYNEKVIRLLDVSPLLSHG